MIQVKPINEIKPSKLNELPPTCANTGTSVAWLAARTIDRTMTATAVKLARVTENRDL